MFYGTIYMADVKPTPKGMQWIRERLRLDLCLCPGCSKKGRRKGLCDQHYNRQYMDGLRMDPMKREKWLNRLKRKGHVLTPYVIRMLRREDSFAKEMREVG